MKKFLFNFLSFTWGLPMTLIGNIVAIVLIAMGHKQYGTYGYCKVFKICNNWGGLSLGNVILTSNPESDRTMKHEHGHALQNCWFGPLMPFIVVIPSAARYWWMTYQIKKGNTNIPDYDSIWFEGQATRVGTEFIEKYFTE